MEFSDCFFVSWKKLENINKIIEIIWKNYLRNLSKKKRNLPLFLLEVEKLLFSVPNFLKLSDSFRIRSVLAANYKKITRKYKKLI